MKIHSVLAFALVLGPAVAQTFEVASIKPNATDDRRVMFRMAPGGGFMATGVTVRQLIAQAWDVREFQISGGPGWLSSDRFDINAKGPADSPQMVPREQMQAMLRNLLQERFALKIREDKKEMPAYVLVAAKNGPKLTASPDSGQGQQRPGVRLGRGMISAKDSSMEMLARMLSQQLGRPVVDKTGLKGNYEFELHWTPEAGEMAHLPGPPPGDAGPASAPADGPTIFAAVQEQLGLKLDSQKSEVPFITVESVSKPTEN